MRCLLAFLITATLQAQDIRRLDNTTIPAAEATGFARQTLEQFHVTGAQIAIVDNGKLAYSAAFGNRRLNQPADAQTTFWSASITKSVFAAYVMQLVQKGEFQLDKPIVRQLPRPLNQYPPYAQIASAVVRDPKWRTVTPRMLLSHTSGLANFSSGEPDKKMHLHFKPGTQYRYSGDGINLVQFVIEQQKHQPLDRLMDAALFHPLGMSRTGLVFREDFLPDVADRFGAGGQFIAETRRFPARAAGSMTTSAEDLARFAIALMDGKILHNRARQEMLKPYFHIGSLHQFAIRANEPEGDEAVKVGLAYGVGWGLLTNTPYGPAFFKEGHGDGAQTYMICFERRKACMIILTNSDNGEYAFRPLLEKLFGDTVTPWEWEGYTPAYIDESRKSQ